MGHEQAFQARKGKLIAPTGLKYPDCNQRSILTTDTSGESLGAVLLQGAIGKDILVAFANRTLNWSEKTYITTEKEYWPLCGECDTFGHISTTGISR